MKVEEYVTVYLLILTYVLEKHREVQSRSDDGWMDVSEAILR